MDLKHTMTRAACSRPVAAAITTTTKGRVPNAGVRVDLSHPQVPNRIRAAVFWRLYERAESHLIRRHLPSDIDVVELGASYGVTGTHILNRATGRVVAVEANPALIPPLRRALADERATVVHAAVDYHGQREVDFYVHPTAHLRSRLHALETGIAPTTVPAVTLSGLLEHYRLRDGFALVADIEGAELSIIRHDRAALERCSTMIVELHDTVHDGARVGRAAMRAEIESLGFRRRDEARNTSVFVR